MKNFIFKSTGADLQKMFQYLEVAQRNILYLTYQVDKLLKIARVNDTDKGLQQQVDKYFEDDIEETSPQTEQDNKRDLD